MRAKIIATALMLAIPSVGLAVTPQDDIATKFTSCEKFVKHAQTMLTYRWMYGVTKAEAEAWSYSYVGNAMSNKLMQYSLDMAYDIEIAGSGDPRDYLGDLIRIKCVEILRE